MQLIEKLWLQVSKTKWPKMVCGSEEYDMRRKAFFMGCMTVVSIMIKVPDSRLEEIIVRITEELKTELGRGDNQIVNPTNN